MARDAVRHAVRTHGVEREGVTVAEICTLTGLADRTVRSHLDTLCKLREVYRLKRSANVVLYYPNGKPLHGIRKEKLQCSTGDTLLEIHLAQGKRDALFIHIIEKRFSLLEGEITEGGVVLPMADVEELITKLRSMTSKEA